MLDSYPRKLHKKTIVLTTEKNLSRRMLTAIALLLLLSLNTIAAGKEYFVLQGIDKTHPDDVVTQPGVDGFTIRVSWDKLHTEGFAWLDQQIRRGDELDADIQLRVLGGVNAPAELAGVSYFEYLSTDSEGLPATRRVPVPWDSLMHEYWQTLVTELGTRYGDNSRIKVVHVPSFANSSELHMPEEVTQLVGYTSRALTESWAAMAEPLASAFPHAIVALNYATPTQARISGDDADWLLQELSNLAGDRAGYQANDLAADVDLERNKYQTLLEQQQLGRHVGFQMVSSSNTARFGGEFLDAVQIAADVGAQWLEIYAADIAKIPPPGDYNFNGAVDAADYVVWRKSDIGQVEYDLWRANFGKTAGNASIFQATTPEPTGALLLLLGAVFVNWKPPRAAAESR